jgi:hypothetical protein
MAIRLNKQAIQCEQIALAGGKITNQSSPQISLYDISKQWRELLEATNFQCSDMPKWNKKEAAAARVLIATLTYLKRIGCEDIEKLLRDAIGHQFRQDE